ncbi:DHH family phosphoesterase [Clostridium sp. UBA4548]|uniref:DHH family phosphoesterase n=1 Tax=Clostridium sp. UBA4548 TaxID=1946361 RepID=UPI0025BA664D|nr:bifunctional oligoribonuclease/PAP phosphatase NrnA [Clostridium sp. UBA4548]
MIMNNILKAIKESQNIAITFHTSPDGDSLGSATALLQGLRALNKNVHILCKEVLPETFKYLPCSNEITGEKYVVDDNTDLVVVLDCGDFKRINADIMQENRSYTLVNIDHHLSNELYADYNFVDTNAAAVGEIIYQMLQLLGVKLTKDMGISLYTSLLTDTGSFRHSNTTSVTHTIAGDVINTGIDFSEIHRTIFDNKKFNRVKLYGKVIDSMTLELNDNAVFMYITKHMLEELGLEKSDTSDVLTYGSMIKDVEVVVLIKESDEVVKVSLRSKNKVDVRRIAEQFNGGGHIRAAGFAFEGSISDIKLKLMEILEKELI